MKSKNVWIISHCGFSLESVSRINANLKKTYREIYQNHLLIDLHAPRRGNLDAIKTKKLFYKFKQSPPVLVVITHSALIHHDLMTHILLSKESLSIKFIFHIFGDFIRRAPSFLAREPLLMGKQILFSFPSKGYCQVVDKFFMRKKSIFTCPIPIDSNFFYFNKKERLSLRRKLELKKQTLLFVYTGRISKQKNISFMAKTLHNACTDLNLDYKLLIMGPMDDLEMSSIPCSELLGTVYGDFLNLKNENKHIFYMIPKQKDIVRKVLNAADVFISLGTFHDESFGFSPLEALCCGTSSLLTRWGGFKDFALDNPIFCQNIKLTFSPKCFEMSFGEFKKCLNKIIEGINKEKCSEDFLKKYQRATISKNLYQKISTNNFITFSGFSQSYHHLAIKTARSHENLRPHPWDINTYTDTYKEIWS